MGAEPEGCPLTSPGRLLGTAQYRRPEVPAGEAEVMLDY